LLGRHPEFISGSIGIFIINKKKENHIYWNSSYENRSNMKFRTAPIDTVKPTENTSLFHYCKLQTALEYILPFKQLLLNPIDRTNDPRENQEFSFLYSYFGKDAADYHNNKHLISESLRSGCKVICFSQNWKNYFGYELSRMWAEYGGNHQGVCLEIDKEIFYNENENLINGNHFDEVTYFDLDVRQPTEHILFDYSSWKSDNENQWLRKFRNENAKDLFFVKNAEWEWERELRLIYFSNEQKNEYCSIKNSLKNIYLGLKYHDSYLPSIKALAPDTNIFKMRWNDARLLPGSI
jgi:hypothetical protein